MRIYLISASAFLALCIIINGVSGLSTMEDSYSVEASNLTNDSVNSGYRNSRMLGQACARHDIVVNQGVTSHMPNGISIYNVEILNVCVTGCSIAEIHLTCGSISALTIDPKLFKRLKYNDCLVNDGKPLKSGGSIFFQYANTFKYPMAVSSVKCVP